MLVRDNKYIRVLILIMLVRDKVKKYNKVLIIMLFRNDKKKNNRVLIQKSKIFRSDSKIYNRN